MKNERQSPCKLKNQTVGRMLLFLFLILITTGWKINKYPEMSGHMKIEQLTDQVRASGNLEQANTAFRATVLAMLKQVSTNYKLPEPDDNFVLVNPMAGFTSPIALTREATMASLSDLEKGKMILLAYFNLPEDAEIASGFYTLYVQKANGEWIAELRDLEGKTILKKKPLVENKTSLNCTNNRSYGIINGMPGVRFGAQLKEISFNMDVKTGISKRITVPPNKYAEALTNEILRFRTQVEGIMKSTFPMKGNIFIATRKDALIIAGLSDESGTLVPTLYIRSGNITSDFYSISREKSQLAGKNSKQLLSATFTDLSKYSSMNIGFIGGVIGNQINLGYIGNMINGEYHIPIK